MAWGGGLPSVRDRFLEEVRPGMGLITVWEEHRTEEKPQPGPRWKRRAGTAEVGPWNPKCERVVCRDFVGRGRK